MDKRNNSLTSFLNKLFGKHYKLIFAGMLALAVVHFAVQVSFIQDENLRSVELANQTEESKAAELTAEIKSPVEQVSKVKTATIEPRQLSVTEAPATIEPVTRRQIEVDQSQPTEIKKKSAKDAKSVRLRRAEKILTGI